VKKVTIMTIDNIFSKPRSQGQLVRRLAPIAVALVAVILNPLRVIPEGTTCAKLRLGQVQNQPVMPGLNTLIPFVDSLDCINVKVQNFQRQVAASTSNIQDLNAKLAVQWRVPPSQVPRVRREFGSLEAMATGIVDPKAEESFKTVSSTRSLESAIGNRTKLKADWESTIKANLRPYPVEVIGLDVVNLAPSQKVAEAIEIKQVAEQEALAATYKATAKKNEALGVIEEARGQAEANRLKAESLRVPGAREVTELEKFRLWAQNGSKVPTTLIVGGEGGFWLSKMLGTR
jgi:regulator of protease activity HflC (stomatin/prohibitin superfamily)